mmetsp:Transcript_89076/g.272799  ORF Transcript_89076/g.272799 Transcript_89076/m.272799 type:complete len:224 (-) Transcript_89076:24-695(-)
MMSPQEKLAMGFKVRLPSSHTSREMRWAAWSMRRPVMRMSLEHSCNARWKGSTLLTKSKSAVSISSQSPYLASNSSRVLTPCGIFHNACLAYFSWTCLAQTRVSGKRCIVSIATRCIPESTEGKWSRIRATNTLSVASHAVAKTTCLPSFGKCVSMSRRNPSTFFCRAGLTLAKPARPSWTCSAGVRGARTATRKIVRPGRDIMAGERAHGAPTRQHAPPEKN